MRLLLHSNAGEFSLTGDLIGDDTIPPYAIFSHTWKEGQEVTFKDMMDGTGKSKTGYDKIRFCGQQAERDGLQHFWVDSCCIDKSSSAELQEAINSMFRWYRNAAKCYVYLSDVSSPAFGNDGESNQLSYEPAFRQSRWFTRGWTLQELLAPDSVEFFSQEGKRLGNKKSLERQIHEITGIPVLALQGTPLSQFKVNERFAWAHKRETTRKEDWAYCLLGIFDVFMPLIYGEGRERAVIRLRKEIYETSNVKRLKGHSDWVRAVAFSPDSNQLASASIDETVRLWDVASGTPLQRLEGYSSAPIAVAFSPDGKQLASASAETTVRLWDVVSGTPLPLQRPEGLSGAPTAVTFSPDGKQLASASADRTVRLWDVVSGTLLQRLEGHSDRVHGVAFSPDGKQLASASADRTVRLWDVVSGTPLQRLESHSDWIIAVAFSPNGKQLASASADETVRLWDVASGTPLQRLEGHSNWVKAVAFSPDGKQLASASEDKTVRLWDVASGTPLQRLEGHSGGVIAVAFSLDGKQLASASADKTVRLWPSTYYAAFS